MPPRTMSATAKPLPAQARRRSSRERSGGLVLSQRKRCLHRVRPERTGPGRPLSRLHLAMPSPPAADAWGERLPRHLGLWSAIAVLVGSTIGSGIFRVPASVAGRLQEPGPVVRRMDRGRRHRSLRRPDPGRAGGGAPTVRRGLRLSPGGLRAPAGLSVRLVRADRHPRLRPRRHLHHFCRVSRLLPPLHTVAGTVRRRRRHRGRWGCSTTSG